MKTFHPVVCLLGLPAVLLWFAPEARNIFLYDRTAILQGEWWRLWTGHWMHFSPSHLLWNLAGLLIAGSWLERSQPGLTWRYAFFAAPLISLVLFFGEPAMQYYAGLSGIVTGLGVLLALGNFGQGRESRCWWTAVLVLVGIKIGLDVTNPQPLLAGFGSPTIRVSALAHAAGAGFALAFFFVRRGRKPTVVEPSHRPGRSRSRNTVS